MFCRHFTCPIHNWCWLENKVSSGGMHSFSLVVECKKKKKKKKKASLHLLSLFCLHMERERDTHSREKQTLIVVAFDTILTILYRHLIC